MSQLQDLKVDNLLLVQAIFTSGCLLSISYENRVFNIKLEIQLFYAIACSDC